MLSINFVDDGRGWDKFGYSVSLSNDIVAIGCGLERGSIYLFRTTDESLIHKLTAEDGAAYDYFGGSVSLSTEVVAVDAPGDDDKGDYRWIAHSETKCR